MQLLMSLLHSDPMHAHHLVYKRLSSAIWLGKLSFVNTQKWVHFYPLDINNFLFCSCLCILACPYLDVLWFIFLTRGKHQEINHFFLFHCCILMLNTQQLLNKDALNQSMNLFTTSSSSTDFEFYKVCYCSWFIYFFW